MCGSRTAKRITTNLAKGGKKTKKITHLFLQFIEIGFCTFGGGWSIVAQMQKRFADEAKMISNEELLDIISIGRSMPGLMVGNIAVFFGYHIAGILGALACVFGMAIPPFVILSAVTYLYTSIEQMTIVVAAMQGVRAAVVPIIICAVLHLMKTAYDYPFCYVVSVATIVLYLLFHMSCFLLVLLGVAAGFMVCKCCNSADGVTK